MSFVAHALTHASPRTRGWLYAGLGLALGGLALVGIGSAIAASPATQALLGALVRFVLVAYLVCEGLDRTAPEVLPVRPYVRRWSDAMTELPGAAATRLASGVTMLTVIAPEIVPAVRGLWTAMNASALLAAVSR